MTETRVEKQTPDALLEGSHVLVTGASGFVGINLVRALAAGGADVIALVRRTPDAASERFVEEHVERIRWLQGDVTDRARMLELADGITHIIHAAAVTATFEEERAAAARVFEVNAGGTLNLLEAAREVGLRRFVFVSSGGLYGPAPPTPALTEDAPLQINNLYGISKRASEGLALRYRELYGFDVAIGRLGTTYGPMERPTGSRHTLSAVHTAVHAAVDTARTSKSHPVYVRGGDTARDFLHVDDAADAFVRLVAAPELNHRLYNIGSPVAYSLRDALDALTEMLDVRWQEVGHENTETNVQVAQGPANARAAMDTSRLERDLGWSPRYDLRAGTRAYLGWLEREGM